MRNITQYSLLVGGYFANISVFTFDPSSAGAGAGAGNASVPAGNATLAANASGSAAGNSSAGGLTFGGAFAHPENPTWFETECGLFAAAESAASVVTRLSFVNGTVKVLQQVSVGGDPVHLTTTPDCSALISSSYANGTISYIPLLPESEGGGPLNSTSEGPLNGTGAGTGAANRSASSAGSARGAFRNSSALGGAPARGARGKGAGRSLGEAVTLAFNHTHANGSAPQDQARAHASLVHGGRIYTADLGSDRVWVSAFANGTLSLEGALELPAGFGPRHMVLLQPDEAPVPLNGTAGATPASASGVASGSGPGTGVRAGENGTAASGNGTRLVTPGTRASAPASPLLYVVGELANNVTAFALGEDAPSAPLFSASVIPPGLNSSQMAAGEIALNPRNRSELFVSNRLAAKSNPDVSGDAVAILSLSADGKDVAGTRWVDSGLDNVRGMRFSPTGEFLALAGLEGGIAIFAEQAGNWTQVARYDDIEQAADFAWIEGDAYGPN